MRWCCSFELVMAMQRGSVGATFFCCPSTERRPIAYELFREPPAHPRSLTIAIAGIESAPWNDTAWAQWWHMEDSARPFGPVYRRTTHVELQTCWHSPNTTLQARSSLRPPRSISRRRRKHQRAVLRSAFSTTVGASSFLIVNMNIVNLLDNVQLR